MNTIGTNFPAILQAVQTQGPLAAQAAASVGTTGTTLVQNLGAAGGQALVCATQALNAAKNATASVQVTVTVSASVSTSAGGPGSST